MLPTIRTSAPRIANARRQSNRDRASALYPILDDAGCFRKVVFLERRKLPAAKLRARKILGISLNYGGFDRTSVLDFKLNLDPPRRWRRHSGWALWANIATQSAVHTTLNVCKGDAFLYFAGGCCDHLLSDRTVDVLILSTSNGLRNIGVVLPHPRIAVAWIVLGLRVHARCSNHGAVTNVEIHSHPARDSSAWRATSPSWNFTRTNLATESRIFSARQVLARTFRQIGCLC